MDATKRGRIPTPSRLIRNHLHRLLLQETGFPVRSDTDGRDNESVDTGVDNWDGQEGKQKGDTFRKCHPLWTGTESNRRNMDFQNGCSMKDRRFQFVFHTSIAHKLTAVSTPLAAVDYALANMVQLEEVVNVSPNILVKYHLMLLPKLLTSGVLTMMRLL